MKHFATKFPCLTVCLFAGAELLLATCRPCSGKVILYDGPARVTVQQLTLVRYSDAQARIAKIRASPLAGDCKPPRHAGYGPASPNWRPSGRATLGAYYCHLLNGVILQYVCDKVAHGFLRLHPGAASHFSHPQPFLRAVHRVARLSQAGLGVLVSALTLRWSKERFFQQLHRTFPTTWPHALYLWQAVGFLRQHGCFFALAKSATPYYRKGAPSPWYRDMCFSDTLQPIMRWYVQAHRKRFVRLLNRQMGSRRCFLASFAGSSGTGALARLVHALAGARGTALGKALQRSASVLRSLGSPTTLQLYRASDFLIQRTFHIPSRKLVPFRPIGLGPAAIYHGRRVPLVRQYLFIAQAKPNAANISHTTSPSGFMFQVAARAILKPIIDQTLTGLRPGAGLHLPAVDAVLGSVYAPWPFPKLIYGVPIPQLGGG